MAGPSGNESNHTIDGLTVRGGLALEGSGGVLTYLNRDVSAYTARQVAKMRARGYYAETYDPCSVSGGGSAAVSGSVYFAAIGLVAGDVVSNITILASTAGSGITLAKVGLYSKASVLLASSASDHTNYNTGTGNKTTAMTTPYTVPADDGYYIAVINVTGTCAAIVRNASGLPMPAVVSGGLMVAGVQTGQTDLPATATISSAGGTFFFWAAVS